MNDLAEVIEKLEEVKELKEKLLNCLKVELSTKGLECVDTKEAGEVVDMIKDLAETEKYCMESMYYQKVTEAMTSYEEPRYGYNMNRYPSGRYAPKGEGSTRMGFRPHVPYLDYDNYMTPDDYMNEAMMGYTRGQNSSSGNNNRGNQSNNSYSGNNSMGYHNPDMDPRYGKAYNEYKMMRRHYTSSKSPEDKHEMDQHAEEHMMDTMTTIRDIWRDADPTMKKKMKENFTKLVGEMTI